MEPATQKSTDNPESIPYHFCKTLKATNFTKAFSTLNLVNNGVQWHSTKSGIRGSKNAQEYKLHLHQGNLIFKILRGKLPIPICRMGGVPLPPPSPTPKGCHYMDEVVLRLLYNFLLLLFFQFENPVYNPSYTV